MAIRRSSRQTGRRRRCEWPPLIIIKSASAITSVRVAGLSWLSRAVVRWRAASRARSAEMNIEFVRARNITERVDAHHAKERMTIDARSRRRARTSTSFRRFSR